ncbi:MAG: hypothetical protein M3R63_01700, partial [Actinomycetota bacterium]|nr:hypothetical protein [Actinomycetota bacterium]
MSRHDEAFGGQHPVHRGLADVHRIEPGTAVGRLAMTAVDLGPGIEHLHGRRAFPAQQPRAAAPRPAGGHPGP